MSGPKDYTPPPRYSINVFNGSLNTIFQLQSQIKELVNRIKKLSIYDSNLNISFDCKKEIRQLDNSINDALKSLVFNYNGTFNQATYNMIENEINDKTMQLNWVKNELEIIQSDFNNKKNDYEQYKNYLVFHENSKISFNDFKDEIINYYEENIKEKYPEILAETKATIQDIKYEKQNDTFSFGFSSKSENKKSDIINYVTKKEGEINFVRSKTSNKIIELSGDILFKTKLSDDIEKIIGSINKIIIKCENLDIKRNYKKQLKELQKSKSLIGEYYYNELFDSIYLSEKNRLHKIKITEILIDLNNENFHKNHIANKTQFAQKITRVLNQSKINDYDVKSIQKEFFHLLNKNNKQKEEDSIIEKERLFLKAQVVTTLTNLGYEVMDDLEVIDFESNNDYLLKVKGQDNYINLMFREDGSLKYNFQIPENKNDLSVDETKLKLEEMKITCDDFNSAISDLRKMGLKMKLNSEKPIAESSIMSFTKKTRERLEKFSRKKVKTQKQSQKKRYLDN
jgi:hypothetical protein